MLAVMEDSWEYFGVTQGSDGAWIILPDKEQISPGRYEWKYFVANRYADVAILSPHYYCQKFLHLHTRRHMKD